MTRQNKAHIFALLAVLCWSTVASAFKLTLRHVDYLTMLLYSSAVSTVFLFVTLMIQGKAVLLRDSLFAGTGHKREGHSRNPRDTSNTGRKDGRHRAQADSFRRSAWGRLVNGPLIRSALNGFLNPFLYYVILFKAYSLLPAQEAQPLNFTWPIVLVFLSAPMLGQRIRPLSVFALTVSFLGVLIVSTHGDLLGFRFTNLPGAILATGSAIVWALFWLTNVRDERDEVLKLFLNFFFGFLYVLAATLLLGLVQTTGIWAREVACPLPKVTVAVGTAGGGALSLHALTSLAGTVARPLGAGPLGVSLEGILGCVYVGIVEMGAAFVLWLKALQLSETTAKVSNLIFLSPFISLIFIGLVVGEKILPSSIVGLAFIAGGIFIQGTVGGRKRE
jgi:drug/metabolite transporter (DMT)-like permease